MRKASLMIAMVCLLLNACSGFSSTTKTSRLRTNCIGPDNTWRLDDLRNCDLHSLNYQKGLEIKNLSQADLSGANLSWANLSNANLVLANLSGANLTGANLTFADLRGANLTDANLTDAYLRGAKMPNGIIHE